MSDLSAGMGWSIYFMLGAVLFMVIGIVFLIIRSDQRRPKVIDDGSRSSAKPK